MAIASINQPNSLEGLLEKTLHGIRHRYWRSSYRDLGLSFYLQLTNSSSVWELDRMDEWMLAKLRNHIKDMEHEDIPVAERPS